MASTFYLEMVSPQDIFYSGNARQIILPGLDGAYGVLPNHEPMVTAITAGIVRYQDQEGRWHMCVASDGCVEVMPERVIVLAATIERAEDIDRNRALAAKHRAEERLRQKQSQHEYIQTQAALAGPWPLKGKARQMRDKEKRRRFSFFCPPGSEKGGRPRRPPFVLGMDLFFQQLLQAHDVVHRQGEEHALAVGLQAGLRLMACITGSFCSWGSKMATISFSGCRVKPSMFWTSS